MTSFATVRDPVKDHLLTPQNSALIIIDYQPVQVSSVASRSKRELVANITALTRIGKLYRLPVVLATVNVSAGINQPTIHQITGVLTEAKPIDRTSINAWEDEEFVRAVRATGRKKLIMAALWTEVCLVPPALDAINASRFIPWWIAWPERRSRHTRRDCAALSRQGRSPLVGYS